MLTLNPDRDRDLAFHLKKQYISSKKVRLGDIIVTDHTCFHVYRIEKQVDGIMFLDEMDNGVGYSYQCFVSILDRSILVEID